MIESEQPHDTQKPRGAHPGAFALTARGQDTGMTSGVVVTTALNTAARIDRSCRVKHRIFPRLTDVIDK